MPHATVLLLCDAQGVPVSPTLEVADHECVDLVLDLLLVVSTAPGC